MRIRVPGALRLCLLWTCYGQNPTGLRTNFDWARKAIRRREDGAGDLLAEPSKVSRISREIRVNRRGKFFALNKIFSQAIVVETYPLCGRRKFRNSQIANMFS